MEIKKIRLSIIVTVYNREKYIRRCIDSLLNQNIPVDEYEILVIDDGSTDRSSVILDEYCKKNVNVRVVHKKNGGVADARNTGIEEARGIYITYIDSDDFVEENCYLEILEFVENNDYDLLISDYYNIVGEDKRYAEIAPFLNEGIITNNEYVLTTPAPWNKLIKRELFEKNNLRFPSGIIYEDYATIPLLANEAKTIYYLKKGYVNYFQDNTSITRTVGFQKKWWDMYIASENLNKMNPKYHNELEYLVYLYLLVRTSSWYLQVGHVEETEKIADYMRKYFPKWKNNYYVKRRAFKERFIAEMIYKKAGNRIIKLMDLKQRIKKYVKKI